MKFRPSRVLLPLCVLLLSGCPFVKYAVRNMYIMPKNCCDTCVLRHRLRRLADEAWHEVVQADPGHGYSKAYAEGFKDGFVDYVEYDGNGEPPAAPPRRFRSPALRSPEGQQAIEDWFAGFRHGAQVASASGLRGGVIVPISRPPIESEIRGYVEQTGGQQEKKEEPLPPGEELPQPRKLPDVDKEKSKEAKPGE
jgi:hypothetical protein